jgi:hypothetical protein
MFILENEGLSFSSVALDQCLSRARSILYDLHLAGPDV